MSLLATGRLARRLAQAPDPRRLAQSVARRRLAAVATVQAQPARQLGDLGLQDRDQLPQYRDLAPQSRVLRPATPRSPALRSSLRRRRPDRFGLESSIA